MRPSLYVRDDDYRYSFLFGNFVTLTNLTEADWQRLAEQRLSPLYVSVHATDLALRRRILGNPAAPDVMGQLRRLGELGIQLHTQVVLMPSLNDGPALAQTVADLAGLYPTVQSIALVPVGLTRYHRCDLRPYQPDEAEPILDPISAWQREYRSQYGLNLVYASDEWYLLAGHDVPSAEAYDGFPQLENGVGLTRVFLDEWEEARLKIQGSMPGAPILAKPSLKSHSEERSDEESRSWQAATLLGEERDPFDRLRAGSSLSLRVTLKSMLLGSTSKVRKIALVCGTLIAPVLEEVAAKLGQLTGLEVEVIPVVNEFFGPTVTVSGLLTGQDVIASLQGRDLGDVVFLSRSMFDAAGEVTLDDMTPLEIEAKLGTRLETAGAVGELVGLLASIS
jgi:NifB/MoaA-like Fe-S oxidoreductase